MTLPSNNLRALRDRARLSQSELAAKAGVAVSRISHWETGERSLIQSNGVMLLQLSTALQCTVGQLIGAETILEKTKKNK